MQLDIEQLILFLETLSFLFAIKVEIRPHISKCYYWMNLFHSRTDQRLTKFLTTTF